MARTMGGGPVSITSQMIGRGPVSTNSRCSDDCFNAYKSLLNVIIYVESQPEIAAQAPLLHQVLDSLTVFIQKLQQTGGSSEDNVHQGTSGSDQTTTHTNSGTGGYIQIIASPNGETNTSGHSFTHINDHLGYSLPSRYVDDTYVDSKTVPQFHDTKSDLSTNDKNNHVNGTNSESSNQQNHISLVTQTPTTITSTTHGIVQHSATEHPKPFIDNTQLFDTKSHHTDSLDTSALNTTFVTQPQEKLAGNMLNDVVGKQAQRKMVVKMVNANTSLCKQVQEKALVNVDSVPLTGANLNASQFRQAQEKVLADIKSVSFPGVIQYKDGKAVQCFEYGFKLPSPEPEMPEVQPIEILSTPTEILPSSTDTLPSSTDTLPSSTDILPSSTDTLPTSTETLPTSTEMLQRSTKMLPSSTEMLLRSTETLSESTKTTMLSGPMTVNDSIKTEILENDDSASATETTAHGEQVQDVIPTMLFINRIDRGRASDLPELEQDNKQGLEPLSHLGDAVLSPVGSGEISANTEADSSCHKCTLCDDSFTNKRSLTNHMRKSGLHEEQNRHECPVCGFRIYATKKKKVPTATLR